MSVAQELKCACPHCNGRIAYPASAGGSTIQCPHCSRAVALPAPVSAPTAAAPGAVSVANQANLKCACRHCNGRISFPPSAAGSSIACPHCGKETPLIAPGVSAPPPPAAAAPQAHAPSPAAPPAARPRVVSPPVPTEEEIAEGAPKKGGGKKTMLIVGIVLAVLLLAGGAFVFLKKGGGGSALSMLGPKDDLQVVSYELQKNQGTSLVYVTGKLKNNTDVQHMSVRVDFKLFDAEGKQIGIAGDYIMTLEPKSEWEFKALVVEPEVAKVEVDKVSSSK